jgi:hypothetical protein
MVAGGGASVIYADTVWFSLFRPRNLFNRSDILSCYFNFLFHLIINFLCADPYCLIRLEILAMLLSLETMQNIVGLPKKRKCYSMPEL